MARARRPHTKQAAPAPQPVTTKDALAGVAKPLRPVVLAELKRRRLPLTAVRVLSSGRVEIAG